MTESIPAPGPAARTQRTAGQVGSVYLLLEFVVAFGWFGSGSWTERQYGATLALLAVVASGVQNLVGHFRQNAANQQEVAPIEAAPPSGAAPRKATK